MKLLRRKRDEEPPQSKQEAEAPVCEHITLVPSWDSAEDIGHPDRASKYRCEACGAEFSPTEATHLRATEAARIQRRIAS